MDLVTISFKDKDILLCASLEDLTFKLNNEKHELEIYKAGEFQGYYASIIGINEEEFIKYVIDSQIEII